MKNTLPLGVVLTLVSTSTYAILTAIAKHTSGMVSTPTLVFIQSLVCFILIWPVILMQGRTDLSDVRDKILPGTNRRHTLPDKYCFRHTHWCYHLAYTHYLAWISWHGFNHHRRGSNHTRKK